VRQAIPAVPGQLAQSILASCRPSPGAICPYAGTWRFAPERDRQALMLSPEIVEANRLKAGRGSLDRARESADGGRSRGVDASAGSMHAQEGFSRPLQSRSQNLH